MIEERWIAGLCSPNVTKQQLEKQPYRGASLSGSVVRDTHQYRRDTV